MNIVFGKKLKELRKEKRLTQEQLSKVLNVSKTTICQWETHKQEACLDDIVKIAQLFDVTTDFLLGLEDESGIKTYINNSFNNFSNNGNFNI